MTSIVMMKDGAPITIRSKEKIHVKVGPAKYSNPFHVRFYGNYALIVLLALKSFKKLIFFLVLIDPDRLGPYSD